MAQIEPLATAEADPDMRRYYEEEFGRAAAKIQ